MKNITVRDTAFRMGKTPSFVRVGLQLGRLPFGTAIKLSSKWTYYINPYQFEQYIGNIEESQKKL
ncbi:hypothetical protein [Clostridium sp. BNL1100]|uniref:hypothetical protein n=1 Tax=Clostridium sp. BNL1100 TaxID=755731 RepID=UPI00024A729E|nr:hypothetical protein [Clostridium sp. BNL1100]AEY66343.1 hypothetical protein Clo1100_2158 [Clostridium sp. BNL1100]